jgi:hypothetical protein
MGYISMEGRCSRGADAVAAVGLAINCDREYKYNWAQCTSLHRSILAAKVVAAIRNGIIKMEKVCESTIFNMLLPATK